MTLLALSLGSNIEREKRLQFAIDSLAELLGELRISPVYETRAVGFEGPDFYNLVVLAETKMELDDLIERIRQIETSAGRVRGEKRFASRNLDIDVLLFGDADLRESGRDIPRREIDHAAYVLKPLADVFPDGLHPISGLRFDVMWAAYNNDRQVPLKVDFKLVQRDEATLSD